MKFLAFILFILSVSLVGQSVGQGFTPTVNTGGGGAIDSTRLFQDSILIYYANGAEIRRDTTRFPRIVPQRSYLYELATNYIAETPLTGWPQTTDQAENSVATVLFTNGTGRYVYQGGSWVLVDFEPKEITEAYASFSGTTNSLGNGTQSWTYRGVHFRTYFTYLKDNPNLTVLVNYFDWETGLFGTPVEWGIPRSGAQDTHAQPSLCVSADGFIIVTQEQLTGTSTNAHNSPIHLRRSDNPEDISAWSPVSGSPFSANLSYPKFARLASGRIMLIHRNYPNDVVSWISDDNGITWTDFDGTAIGSTSNSGTPYVVTYGDNSWAYSSGFNLDNGYLLTLDRRLSSSSHYPQAYAIFTFDGETWGNWEWYANDGVGGFSKDCTLGTAISQTELNANCLLTGVANSNSTTNQYGYIRDVKVDDGFLAVCYTSVLSGTGLGLRFKVFDRDYNTLSDTDVYLNTVNPPASYNLQNAMILPIKSSRGAYDLLLKEQDGQVVRYITLDYGKTYVRRLEELTDAATASLSFRGYGERSPEYGVQAYLWEDPSGQVFFFAEKYGDLYAR